MNSFTIHSTNEKQFQVEQSPISLDKSNNIIIQVLAKPGAKQNGITGTYYS